MKKFIIAVCALTLALSLCSCGSKVEEPTETDFDPALVDASIESVDIYMQSSIGDYIIKTDYEEKSNTYMAFVAIDGAHAMYGTDEFFACCSAIDVLAESAYEDYATNDLSVCIMLVSDITYDICLYANLNGNDITDYMNS